MNNATIQSIADILGLGKCLNVQNLPDIEVVAHDDIFIGKRSFFQTTHGSYIVIFNNDEVIHDLWWKDVEVGLSKMKQACGFSFAKELKTTEGSFVVHKNNQYYFVFSL